MEQTLKVRGTLSCLQAIYKQAEAIASLARPFKFLPSCTCLNNKFARSTIDLDKLIRSAIPSISLKAFIKVRSDELICK